MAEQCYSHVVPPASLHYIQVTAAVERPPSLAAPTCRYWYSWPQKV